MQPRPYQSALIDATRARLATLRQTITGRKPRIMVQAGCGAGKTAIAAFISKAAIDKGNTVAFICHRDFLMQQTSDTFKRLGIRHSFLAAGKPLNPHSKCHIGMVGSMPSRQGKVKAPAICFVDEGHHGVAKTWRKIIEAWPDTTFIFLSATPGARSDGVGLDELCDDIVCGPSVGELIELGALSQYRWLRGQAPAELMALKKVAGEYSIGQQAEIMDRAVIIGDIVGTYKSKAMGSKAIYFAPNIKTSQDYAAAFNAAGIPAAHMDKDTPNHERKRLARAMARGDLYVLTNCTLAGEGYDLAAQAGEDVTIETVGICRRTASLPFLIQMAMRSMRAKPTPGLILDHADNYAEHQWLPDDEIEWSLTGAERRPKVNKDVTCPGCHATLGAGIIWCPHCGSDTRETRAEVARKRAEIEHIEGELIEVRRQAEEAEKAVKFEKKLEEWQCKTYDEWLALAKRRGYRKPEYWAKIRHESRGRKAA